MLESVKCFVSIYNMIRGFFFFQPVNMKNPIAYFSLMNQPASLELSAVAISHKVLSGVYWQHLDGVLLNPGKAPTETFKILTCGCRDLLVLWLLKTDIINSLLFEIQYLPMWSDTPLSFISSCSRYVWAGLRANTDLVIVYNSFAWIWFAKIFWTILHLYSQEILSRSFLLTSLSHWSIRIN